LRDFADLGGNNGQTNKGRPYCQQQNCSSLKLYFSALMLLGIPPLWTCNQNTVGENGEFTRKYLANGK